MYADAQTLTLKTLNNRPIYYTLDGTAPEAVEGGSTRLYTQPIQIINRATQRPRLSDQMSQNPSQRFWRDEFTGSFNGNPPSYNRGTVIRAAVVKSGGTLGEIFTGSYFVWPNHAETFNLPLISITIPSPQLFASRSVFPPQGGIYRYYSDSISGYIATFEYFDRDKNPIFFRDGELRIANGRNSGGPPQKTFNVNLNRGLYNDEVEYPLWGNMRRGDNTQPVTSFSRFRLRNASDNYLSSGFNNALAMSLASDLNAVVSANSYTAVYLNGDFWGIYALEEQYSDRFLAQHFADVRGNMIQISFDSNCENVPEVSFGNESTARASYNAMYNFALNNPIFTDSIYQQFARDFLNLDTYTDALLAHIFFNASDFPGNNSRMWRARYPNADNAHLDGRWHQMLYDFDRAFSPDFLPEYNMLAHLTGVNPAPQQLGGANRNPEWSTLFFRRLLTNAGFRARLLARAQFFRDEILSEENVDKHINALYNQIAPMQEFQNSRWMLDADQDANRQIFKDFISLRKDLVMQHFTQLYATFQ